ncbi:MAG: chorismate mutase, partial [Salinibacter sp.]
MDPSTPPTLEDARTRIDEINRRVVELLAERQAIVDELCEIKAEAGRSVRDPEREAELLAHVRTVAADAGLPPDLAETLFEEILAHSVEHQRRRRDEDSSGTPEAASTDPDAPGLNPAR